MSSDEAIQLTNNDASTAKAYAVSKGYWSDPYLSHFVAVKHPSGGQPPPPVEHKPPEMSRGYFARVNAIRSTVYRFLSEAPAGAAQCQVVNLGCGFDTLFFDLCDRKLVPRKYVEMDFGRIVAAKARVIRSKRTLSEKLVGKKEQPSQPEAAATLPTSAAGEGAFKQPFLIPSLPASSGLPGPNNEIK